MALSLSLALAQTSVELKKIANYGCLAPNSHNAQMWNVVIDTLQKTIFIDLNKDRLLSEVDSNNREAWISCGAFVQNCVFAATDYGYKNNVDITEKGILLTFEEGNKEKAKYLDLIKKRCTVRKPYKKKEMPISVVDSLKSLSSQVLFYPSSSLHFNTVVTISQKANKQQMNDKAKMEELAQWIRFSQKESIETQDGISLRELGMNGFERFMFRMFVNRDNFSDKNLLHNQAIKKANGLYEKCSGYILITSSTQTQHDWINAGMLLQCVWLKCVENNIYVHPMSQAIEEEPYYTHLKEVLNINGEIQMILRVGFSNVEKETTKRRLNH